MPTSGDLGSGNDAIVLLSDGDEGDQGPQDEPMMKVSGAEAASGGESSANGGALGGSPKAPPQTLPGAGTPSLSRVAPEEARRAASRAGKHGNDGVPGGSGRQNLRRSAHDKNKTSPVKHAETLSGDDMLHLSSVVSRACPGRPDRRIASSAEGLSKQEVKAEDSPVAASGDRGSGDVFILLETQDEPGRVSGAEAASSGGGSSANGGTSGGSPAAPPPTSEARTASLSRGAREVVGRAATSTGKRKQPDGDEGGPSCVGRQTSSSSKINYLLSAV